MVRLRAGDLAAMFEVYMLGVVLGALKTALDTKGPWYPEIETLWVYGATLIGGVVLLSVIATGAMLLLPPRELTGLSQASAPANLDGGMPPVPKVADKEINGILDALEDAAGTEKGAGRLVAEVATAVEARAITEPPELIASRRLASRRILRTLLGPALAAALFSGVSAALLPGAGGLMQSEFTINTFVVLTLAYGWGGLVTYAVSSIFLAAARP